MPAPPSCVRLLRDEEELAEALGRAMAYERTGTALYESRLVRYDQALRSTLSVLVELPEPAPEDAEAS